MEQGIVIFMLADIGTRCESIRPFLYQGNGEFLRIWKQGDNPFINESIKPFDGKKVKVIGHKNENDVFCVDLIEEI